MFWMCFMLVRLLLCCCCCYFLHTTFHFLHNNINTQKIFLLIEPSYNLTVRPQKAKKITMLVIGMMPLAIRWTNHQINFEKSKNIFLLFRSKSRKVRRKYLVLMLKYIEHTKVQTHTRTSAAHIF